MIKMDENFEHDFVSKIVVIGDGAVGKTSLITKYTQNTFNSDYIATIGAQFSAYDYTDPEYDDLQYRLMFWDIAGQKEFSFMRPTFYKGAEAVILVFDLTRKETLKSVADWLEEVKEFCGDIPAVLFGNKVDLPENEQQLNKSFIHTVMYEHDIQEFFKTSAKTGENVYNGFNYIINQLLSTKLQIA